MVRCMVTTGDFCNCAARHWQEAAAEVHLVPGDMFRSRTVESVLSSAAIECSYQLTATLKLLTGTYPDSLPYHEMESRTPLDIQELDIHGERGSVCSSLMSQSFGAAISTWA